MENVIGSKLLKSALALVEKGFYVFPLVPGDKLPAIKNFPQLASRDPEQIKLWWAKQPNYNVGISTDRYNGEGEALLAVDVDNKGDKRGDEALIALELEGEIEFPKTFEQLTPTGGRHLIYRTKEAVRQGVNVLAPGLDIRSSGGYLVGAGSVIGGKEYSFIDSELSLAPESLILNCKKPRKKSEVKVDTIDIDQARASNFARQYLDTEAPVAIEGATGDQTTFFVAAKMKDFGLSKENAFMVLTLPGGWNERCLPPWGTEELKHKIENAYRYGSDFVGSSNPEVIFSEVKEAEIKGDDKLHPILELNKEYAFIIVGGKAFVIKEAKDSDGRFRLEYLTVNAFQQLLLPQTLLFNDKKHQIADLWLRSPHRRTYTGLCFMPGEKAPSNLYNLWRGFSVKPSDQVSERAKKSVEMFLSHIRENICANDESLYLWIMTYFAHLVQKPGEKPIVAPVFKGEKGVGKNTVVECIGELLHDHYLVVSDPRYLMGNFNGHLENCLLFVLDEAFWSGNKQAEGRLKDLITGRMHVIERKGSEAYTVKNCTRVVIIGNEDWLVPASHDERRFAVFNIGNSRQNDFHFFTEIKEVMVEGGYQYLLKMLNEIDLTKANINRAPATIGLMEQKISSLSPFYEWWLECLREGRLTHSDFSTEWECTVERDRFRSAYRRFVKERNLRIWGEADNTIGKLLTKCLPSVQYGKQQLENGRTNTYVLPDLATARKEWEKFIGYAFNWG